MSTEVGLTDGFKSPINTALLLAILYVVRTIIFPSPATPTDSIPHEYKANYSWMPKAHPPTVLFKIYTAKTLEPFNGKDGGRILLAIQAQGKDERTVFDVTAGRSFYGPDGMYGNFAGRDASRGMAKQSFDEEMLTPIDQPLDKLSDLNGSELDNMRGWWEHFAGKYIICGRLEAPGQ